MIAPLAVALLTLTADPKAAPPAPSQPNPMEQLDDVQITGWSADEARFSVRAFQPFQGDMGDEGPPDCKGYIDQNGKPFMGALIVAAYERGKLLKSWVVQDYPECTPPEKAKATLTEAKAELAKLGIDLTKHGTKLPCPKNCDLKHNGATFVVENTTKCTPIDETMEGKFKGTVRLWLKAGKAKTNLFEMSFDETYSTIMGGRMIAGVRPVEISPGGKALWLRAFSSSLGGRGGSSTQVPIGFFEWNGDALEEK